MREEAGGFFERLGELRVFRGVFVREASDSSGGPGSVIVEEERLSVGSGSEDARIGRENFVREFIELEVARNGGV